MDSDRTGKKDKENPQSPMFGNEYGAVEQSDPYHRDRNDLDLHWNGSVYHEVTYVRSQPRMIHQPIV